MWFWRARVPVAALALVVSASAGLSISPVGAATAAHYSYYVDGYRLAGQYGSHSFVRDRDGRSHVATVSLRHEVRYYSRAHGSSMWDVHAIPGMSDTNTQSHVQLALSPDRRRVYLAANCVGGGTDGPATGLYVLAKRADASNFPAARARDRVVSHEGCTDENGPYYWMEGLVGLPQGRVGLLYGHGTQPLYYATGVPGQPFTTTHHFPGYRSDFGGPVGIARDHSTGDLVMAAYLVEDQVPGLYVFRKHPGHSWSRPHLIETVSVDDNPVVTGVVAAQRRVWIGIDQRHGAFLISRNSHGHWSARHRVPHTTSTDRLGPLAITNRGALHLLFTAGGRSGSATVGGLRHVWRTTSGTWSAVKHLTGDPIDHPEDLSATPHGGFRYSCICSGR